MPFPASLQESEINIQIGKKLRMYRQLKGLSQEAVAKYIGVTYQQIQRYEKGRSRISAARLNQLCRLLGVSHTAFFDDNGQEFNISYDEATLLRHYRAMSQYRRDKFSAIAEVFNAL